MSKELEALSLLVEKSIYGNKENNRGSIFQAEKTIKQALTPPTSDEVCKALDIVNEALEQPDNSVIFKHTALTELKKVIEKAQKQEKWLNKIKEILDRQDDSCIVYVGRTTKIL